MKRKVQILIVPLVCILSIIPSFAESYVKTGEYVNAQGTTIIKYSNGKERSVAKNSPYYLIERKDLDNGLTTLIYSDGHDTTMLTTDYEELTKIQRDKTYLMCQAKYKIDPATNKKYTDSEGNTYIIKIRCQDVSKDWVELSESEYIKVPKNRSASLIMHYWAAKKYFPDNNIYTAALAAKEKEDAIKQENLEKQKIREEQAQKSLDEQKAHSEQLHLEFEVSVLSNELSKQVTEYAKNNNNDDVYDKFKDPKHPERSKVVELHQAGYGVWKGYIFDEQSYQKLLDYCYDSTVEYVNKILNNYPTVSKEIKQDSIKQIAEYINYLKLVRDPADYNSEAKHQEMWKKTTEKIQNYIKTVNIQ